MSNYKKIRALPRDVARCPGNDCNEKESCMRYLSSTIDDEAGPHTYSFFNPKTCVFKIEIDNERL